MNEPAKKMPRTGLGLSLVVVGTLVLIALAAFVTIAVNYRHTFTASDMPVTDIVEATVMLSPVLILGLLLVGYGHRMMRRG
jgi:heme/copper-type cytochrome/quinol oxidase subunit 2